MKVLFTPAAQQQFLHAVAYILSESPSAALAFRKRAATKLRRLQRFPESGRLLAEFSELPFREVLVNPYRLFYTVRGKVIWVVAVWHDAQLPEEPGVDVSGRAPR